MNLEPGIHDYKFTPNPEPINTGWTKVSLMFLHFQPSSLSRKTTAMNPPVRSLLHPSFLSNYSTILLHNMRVYVST